ncbi:hypothetical protein VTK56DRAFT_6611 [Thermocarpiscus australiensis]
MLSLSSDLKDAGGSQDDPAATKTQIVTAACDYAPEYEGVTAQAISISDLLHELQETNRLLRAIASQNAAQNVSPTATASSGTEVAGAAVAELLPSKVGGQIQPPSTPDPGLVKERAQQLVHELAHAAFAPSRSWMELFRDDIIELIAHNRRKAPHGTDEIDSSPRYHVRLAVSLPDSPGSEPGEPSELLWYHSSYLNWTRRGPVSLKSHEIAHLRSQWPLQFDLELLTMPFLRNVGWILGNNNFNKESGALCAAPLFYGPGRNVLPANAILDASRPKESASVAASIPDSELVSPGSIWCFTTAESTDAVLTLSRLALISAVCLMKHDASYAYVQEFLHEFCSAWKPLYLRGHSHHDQQFYGWFSSGAGELAYRHTIRCFSSVPVRKSLDAAVESLPHVRCHREAGQFPTLSGTRDSSFLERRMSVLCRWAYSADRQFFTVVVLGDFQIANPARHASDRFTDWEDRHFVVRGENSGYHALQSAVHRMLMYWEKEWSQCLDELEQSVNTQLNDILSEETSSRLMFDTSFSRSRVYFKTIEMLRIFADTIRETGRDLQDMDPERLLQGSFRNEGYNVGYFLREDPAKDEALWKNWQILCDFQRRAEDRLLQRIRQKTEEIKGLRDGLFNATSLLEASRSTTMNRYIIVFTIMTVLYLPPTFILALFDGPLFQYEDQAEIVEQFKISTVIACVTTYVLAFALIWVADKWDIARSLYRETHALWRSARARLRGRSIEHLRPASVDTEAGLKTSPPA